jgi:UDP-N-acetylmuramoyl-tripeptide--D-alanyl-D-alanine ligase
LKYALSDLPGLLRTPLGRLLFVRGVRYRAWPLYATVAAVYRRTLVRRTRFVAVVGSFGKSTTARATMAALGGDPSRVSERNAWTSIAQNMLGVRRGDPYAVLEVGIDGPGQMASYARLIGPDLVIVTKVGSEHGRSLGGLEGVRHEKAEMVRKLDASGIAVLNGDDPNVLWMKSQTRARVITFGWGKQNDVVGSDMRLDWPTGSRFRIHWAGETREVQLRLIGLPMVNAALGAAAAALAEGRDLDRVVPGLEALSPTPGRLEPVALEGGAYLLQDDHKSPLETVHAALDTFEQIPAGRKLIVMGEISEPPGSQGPVYREVGLRMARMAEKIILVGGNFQRYAAGARKGGRLGDALIDAKRSVHRAAEALGREIREGDVVLIKGRDTQRLDRVAFLVAGRPVACDIPFCDARLRCDACPMLQRGWYAGEAVLPLTGRTPPSDPSDHGSRT